MSEYQCSICKVHCPSRTPLLNRCREAAHPFPFAPEPTEVADRRGPRPPLAADCLCGPAARPDHRQLRHRRREARQEVRGTTTAVCYSEEPAVVQVLQVSPR